MKTPFFRFLSITLITLGLIIGISYLILKTNYFGNQSAKSASVRLTKPPVALTQLFPQSVGKKWTYEGFAEYRDTRSLLSIQKPKNKSSILEVMNFSGKVADLSGGGSKRNYNFHLRYLFSKNSVYEEILQADTPFPHQIHCLKILTLPIKKGATWQQQIITQNAHIKKDATWQHPQIIQNTYKIKIKPESVKSRTENGKLIVKVHNQITFTNPQTKKLQAQILELRTENGKQIVKVRYRMPMSGMPNGIYEEIREFTTGIGLTYFENTFDENSENRFQYRLYELQQ